MKKGFTLIELLIVIAIIGILAVAFVPTIMGAPSKGRDTTRIADIQKIQKVVIAADLEGSTDIPSASNCITDDDTGANFNPFKADFGGVVPVDPQGASVTYGATTKKACANGEYYFVVSPGTYSYAVMAVTENIESANTTCEGAIGGEIKDPTDADHCYAVLIQ